MRSLLFSVSLVICLSATGQDYKPLVVQGNSWATVGWSWGWGWTEYYFFKGDTVINSTAYKKVYLSPDSTFQNIGQYMGGIREDTVNKEVYFYMNEYTGENLLYKYGLDPGDTLTFWSSACGEILMSVSEVDTITDLFGIDRRRMAIELWYDENNWYDEYWIEGIGSTMGLLTSANFECIADLNFETLCFSNDGVLYYMNPLYDTCYITIVGIEQQKLQENKVIIIPNPVTGISSINLPDNKQIKNIKVFDSFGRMIYEPTVSNPIIERDFLNTGIYILKVENEKGEVYTNKFIVR